MTRYVIWFFLTLSLTGCATTGFHSDGFVYKERGYAIQFTYPSIRAFIDENWKVDNFSYDYSFHEYRRKKGIEYYGDISVDRNNDGAPEIEKDYFCDFVLRHINTNGMIWVFTRDITPWQSTMSFDSVIDNYIKTVSGPERRLCGDVFGYQKVEPSFAVTVLEKTESKIGPYSATTITLAVGELNERSPDDKYAIGKIRVHFVVIDGTIEQWVKTPEVGTLKSMPGKILMTVGYFNTLEFFDKHLSDHNAFLSLISFQKKGKK